VVNPEFDPLCARLSPPRCLTCSLGLQDAQWAVGNSRGARKLARTPHDNNKKKKNKQIHGNFISKKLIYVEKKQMETRIALLLSF